MRSDSKMTAKEELEARNAEDIKFQKSIIPLHKAVENYLRRLDIKCSCCEKPLYESWHKYHDEHHQD